jgi:hypothetical protein
VKLIASGGMRAPFRTGTASPPLRTLFFLATAAGLSLAAACTSGTTANCSAGDGGGPDACGVPAGDSGELPDTTMETGTGDSATETGSPETGSPETGSPETGSPEAAPDAPTDAPKG